MGQKKIRVSIVKYLNSIPFVFGLEKYEKELNIELQFDTPADCADKLKSDKADLGLIPVSEISTITNGTIVGEYCIGADGPVFSVCLTGDSPVEEMERIYMDPHSRTSVNLAKILAREVWMKEFTWLEAESGFEKDLIKEKDGGVVIGDKVFEVSGKYKYQYDLAEAWKEYTGYPIVFAAWVANRQLESAWIQEFNEALAHGVSSIPQVLKKYSYQDQLQNVDLEDYLTHKISYPLDKRKRAGMALFLEKIMRG